MQKENSWFPSWKKVCMQNKKEQKKLSNNFFDSALLQNSHLVNRYKTYALN